jgi:hypothetical protein
VGGADPGDGGEPGAGEGGAANASGSAGASGAAAGEGGAPNLGGILAGHYDLFLDEGLPEVPGCTPTFSESRWNLSIELEDGELSAMSFRDFDYGTWLPSRTEVVENLLEIAARPGWHPNLYASPALSLRFDREGFTGGGQAHVVYVCGELPNAERSVPLRVRPDTTRPRVRVRPTIGANDGPVFPFTEFVHDFSEPVTHLDGSYDDALRDLQVAAETIALNDPERHGLFTTEWLFALGGPLAQQRLVDMNEAVGLDAASVLLASPEDAAGNPALAETRVLPVIAGATLPLDFDTVDGTGSYGNATYHPPGAADSPCESGGCLSLDAPTDACGTSVDAPSGLGLYLPADVATHSVRLRLWTTEASTATVQVMYPGGCFGELAVASTNALPVPDGEYTHASEWSDREFSVCAGPERDRGVILVPGCAPRPGVPPKPNARLVIERIERVD